MRKILGAYFFQKSAVAAASRLLGKFIVRKIGTKTVALMLTETEAYDGFNDKASHAHRGKTARNAPMFGASGHWYVYFTYGMHWLINIVTGPENYPAAVLLRGCVYYKNGKEVSINGPARLAKFLKITGKFSGKKADKKTGLWIEDRGVRTSPRLIKKSPRVGVGYAGKWAKKEYRFYIKDVV